MSSWRKLMTPVYDKYFSRNNSTSTLLSSQIDQGTPLPSTVRESQKSISTNIKLSKLQEEMNKLKKELNKYPGGNNKAEKRQNSKKSSNKKLTYEEEDQYSFSENYHNLESVSPINGNIRIEDSSRQVSSNRFGETPESALQHYSQTIDDHGGRRVFERIKGKRLIDEYPYPMEEEQSDSSEDIASTRRRVETDYHDEDRDEVHLDDINPAMTYVAPRYENREIMNENQIQTEKPKRKTVEKTSMEASDINESLKKALSDCQNEISGLRELVMSSKKKIDNLEGELEKEKVNAQGLRKELNKQTTLKPKRKNVVDKENSFSNSIEESEEPGKNQGSAKRGQKMFTTEVDSDQENKNFKNLKTKIMTMNSSGKKVPPTNNTNELAKEKSKKNQTNTSLVRSDKKSQNTFTSTRDTFHGTKEIAVQCDCMLDDIADNTHQEDMEKLQDEISSLKMEARSLKGEKNRMIETFQEIIQLLASEKTSKKNRTEEIKEDFGSFFDEFRRRASEIVIPGPVHINKDFLDTLPTKVPNTTMGKSRHGRTELSDNLMYSPSIYESNFDGLGDSKINVDPFTRRDYTDISDI